MDNAIKAYINHTEAILQGEGSLDISQLLQPLQNAAGAAHAVQLALANGHFPNAPGLDENGHVIPPDSKKRAKRPYKQRDPNAPKRPLTAYFRYLREVRPIIAKEIADSPPSEGTKAGDISKIATERWKALSDAKRKPYHEAYQGEMGAYEDAVKAYKASGGNVDAEGDEEEDLESPAQPVVKAAAAADSSSDESDEDTSSDDDSSSSEDEAPVKAIPPPKPVKSASPEVTKKTPKSTSKKVKAGADAAANPNIDPQLTAPPPAPMVAPPSSPTKKRKSAAEDGGSSKKRGRSSKKDQAEAAAPVPVPEVSHSEPSTEKKKKKKRKSEAAAA